MENVNELFLITHGDEVELELEKHLKGFFRNLYDFHFTVNNFLEKRKEDLRVKCFLKREIKENYLKMLIY